ncbi:hypothetical protein HMSLTHF_25510 [Vreelandella aquamarina]|uniref:Uncharacterized protein n=1 Tax=Vreelandella aquamarina TaxID=77097 RepID=A0A6F8SYJ5_9GAMM|nr:hypothetical protein HMSLTHF_25510 [Halomonas meridiana]
MPCDVLIEKVVLLTYQRGSEEGQQQKGHRGPYFQYMAYVEEQGAATDQELSSVLVYGGQ